MKWHQPQKFSDIKTLTTCSVYLYYLQYFLFHFSGICPLLCSGHGVYGGGECHCTDGWKGSECDVRASECLAADCSAHGQCREGVCICNPGWTGEHCQTRKIPSTYLPVNNISCYPAFIVLYSRLLLKEKQKCQVDYMQIFKISRSDEFI